MSITFGSVCSGIEAASAAWHPLGWKAAFFSEIEPFPCAVLDHHYPDVPNLGDMTKYKEWDDYAIDVLVGGTPCQSFSIAGLRAGLDDPRGNLMLTYLAIADKYRPEWLVWENVPGVLSSNNGRDFGTFLGGLAQLGYGFAYRVLDAQYFGVPQRRRRVFVVANSRSWQRAAAVLFERESLCGNPAPSREKGKDVAGTISRCSFTGGASGRPEGAAGNHFIAEVAPTLNAHFGTKQGLENQHIDGGGGCSSVAKCLITKTRLDAETETLIPTIGGVFSNEVAHTLRAQSNASHRADSDNYVPVAAYGIPGNWIGRKPENGGNAVEPMVDVAPCQTKTDRHGVAVFKGGQGSSAGGIAYSETTSPTLSAAEGGNRAPTLMRGAQVRRLTPVECERLQGFPDRYTEIPYRNKSAEQCPDGPRYKALGNSMAVPVMRWIGERIEVVSRIDNVADLAA